VAGAERYQNKEGKLTDGLIARPWDMVISRDKAYIYLAENNNISVLDYLTGIGNGS